MCRSIKTLRVLDVQGMTVSEVRGLSLYPTLHGAALQILDVGPGITARLEPSCTSQAQPEPNWLTPAFLSCSWKSANEPKAEPIASARPPSGPPPPSVWPRASAASRASRPRR